MRGDAGPAGERTAPNLWTGEGPVPGLEDYAPQVPTTLRVSQSYDFSVNEAALPSR